MPNRIIREGILTSSRVTKLGWPDECFYRRLMSVVDDFGRYFADPGLLRAACYPRQLNKVSDSDIEKWLACVQKAALVRVYSALDGERYLELLDFRQQVRAKESKFPPPIPSDDSMHSTCVADATQVIANEHLDVSVFVSVSDNSSPPLAAGGFDGFWAAYPRKVGKDAARKAFDKRKPDSTLLAQMLSAIARQIDTEQWRKDGGQFIPHPATWLNEGRWQDESEPIDLQSNAAKSARDETEAYLAKQAAHAAEVERQRKARLAAKQGEAA
jgi:hypothetical protein